MEVAMDITGVSHAMSVPVAAAAEIPPDKAAENRTIVQAVKALNGTEMFGQGNQLTFQWDASAQRMLVRVINPETQQVMWQIPPEYVLSLAENLKQQQAVGTSVNLA